MARRLPIQFCGARYHIINRGNLQHNVFITPGAIRSFGKAPGQAASQYQWRVHAYVVMRNHYHRAIETPQPNLVDGMHSHLTPSGSPYVAVQPVDMRNNFSGGKAGITYISLGWFT